MKIVQSFWSKPFIETESLSLTDSRFNGGWPHRLFNYYSWALSCLQLRKFYDQVELVTDEFGKEILIDKLNLPYTHVSVALNNINHFHPGLWALGKLYAYGMQNEPFLHVDSDVFIWKAFGDDIIRGSLVAQNLENVKAPYSSTFKQICETFDRIPEFLWPVYKEPHCPCCNAGILGGRDISFIKAYVAEAFSFLTDNLADVERVVTRTNAGHLNVIMEQVIFYAYALYSNLAISYLFPDATMIPPGVGHFHAAARNKEYVHCYGYYKGERLSYAGLEWKLMENYPVWHQKIGQLVRDRVI